jgi:hypothetical protein
MTSDATVMRSKSFDYLQMNHVLRMMGNLAWGDMYLLRFSPRRNRMFLDLIDNEENEAVGTFEICDFDERPNRVETGKKIAVALRMVVQRVEAARQAAAQQRHGHQRPAAELRVADAGGQSENGSNLFELTETEQEEDFSEAVVPQEQPAKRQVDLSEAEQNTAQVRQKVMSRKIRYDDPPLKVEPQNMPTCVKCGNHPQVLDPRTQSAAKHGLCERCLRGLNEN